MAVSTTGYSASQQASAELHLGRREDWRYVRIGGVRYVMLPSGRSGHIYTVRGDARGCSCRWYAETQRDCSHMLAVSIANDEDAAMATLATGGRFFDSDDDICSVKRCTNWATISGGTCREHSRMAVA